MPSQRAWKKRKGKKKEVNPNHPVFRCSDQIQNLSRQLQSVGRQADRREVGRTPPTRTGGGCGSEVGGSGRWMVEAEVSHCFKHNLMLSPNGVSARFESVYEHKQILKNCPLLRKLTSATLINWK